MSWIYHHSIIYNNNLDKDFREHKTEKHWQIYTYYTNFNQDKVLID